MASPISQGDRVVIDWLIEIGRNRTAGPAEVVEMSRLASSSSPLVSSVAVSTLRVLGPLAASAVPHLIELLQLYLDHVFAQSIARALGAIGPQAAEAIPVLYRARHTNNRRVRTEARRALEQIIGCERGKIPPLSKLHDSGSRVSGGDTAAT